MLFIQSKEKYYKKYDVLFYLYFMKFLNIDE